MKISSVIDEIDVVTDSIKEIRGDVGDKLKLKIGKVLTKNSGFLFLKKVIY